MSYTSHLKQTCTLWVVTGSDLYGKSVFASPVTKACRWEEKTEEVVDKHGETYMSKTRVFLADAVPLESYLFLGVSNGADPTLVDGAREVRQIANTPDLRALKTLRVAYL